MQTKSRLLSFMLLLTVMLLAGILCPLTSNAVTITTEVDDQHEKITIDCSKNSGEDGQWEELARKYCAEHPEEEDCPEGGFCNQGGSAVGVKATGFYGIGVGQPNPVPTRTPPYTCQSGRLCANEGQQNCSLTIAGGGRCKNTYTYSTRACACMCK